ncbi:MAG TPA: hypothetical protein VJH33_00525 [Candidatus Paceibacterota bacterium]
MSTRNKSTVVRIYGAVGAFVGAGLVCMVFSILGVSGFEKTHEKYGLFTWARYVLPWFAVLLGAIAGFLFAMAILSISLLE